MSAVANLRTMARTCEVVHHGVTLSSDVRNVHLHEGLLENSHLRVTDLAKVEFTDNIFTCNSEEELRIYDSYKKVLGFEKACDLMQSKSLDDESSNKILIQTPYKNKTRRALIKYVVATSRQIHISKDNVHLSDLVKQKLEEIGGVCHSKPEDGKRLAKEFMKELGSHYQGGRIQHGGAFEWVVTWESNTARKHEEVAIAKELLESSCDLRGSKMGIWYDGNQVIAEDQGTCQGYDRSNIQVRVTKFGGNDGTVEFKAWKAMAERKKGDKILVDGDTLFPVFDLFKEQRQQVANGSGLAKYMNEVWNEDVKHMPPSPRDKLIELLGLLNYQDVGISIDNVRAQTLSQHGANNQNLEQIPWQIIEKWMRVDYMCRDNKTIKGVLEANRKLVMGQSSFHPMDVFLVVFTSCDMLLKQLLVQKLAHCRLAIPFAVPYDNHLELSLWPLRSVSIEWNTQGETKEASLVKHPFKVVSCLRIGDTAVSKSKLLNDMMASTQKETFFHREASAGNKKRDVANGLIEMSYFLPKNGSGPFKEEVLFLNLRGDAQQYPQQCQVLSKVSSVIMCVVDLETLEQENVFQILTNIQEHCANVTVILTTKDASSSNEDMLLGKLNDKSLQTVKGYDFDGPVAASDLAYDAGMSIARSLSDSHKTATSLQEQTCLYKEAGCDIDEDNVTISTETRNSVDDILQGIKKYKLADAKVYLLPLQAQVLQKWTKLLKKKHRDIKSVDLDESMKEKDKIADKMYTLRKEQLSKSDPLQAIMKTFIEFQLLCHPRLGNDVFFKMLKIELDDLSRSVLPALRQIYQDAWQNREDCPDALSDAERMLDESSFGQEHLFREMGQLYECLKLFPNDITQEEQDLLPRLPLLAARYFLSGHSMEIMDGDSGVVPLTWVHAVLDSLHNIIGEKKMFVLSVVGVQSSGKSTLLNAMFGLELAVGAGRCTRGIYAQLLPVDKKVSDIAVDYILVLDSEGLCGTKEDGKYEHDNEIATLVIGLADLTIVNIKGENTQQMKDIFEIAVHAFLRMKAVKKYKKQKCIFLHQSVSSTGAIPQLMRDRHTLQTNLDNMTKAAAVVENMAGTIHKFRHVIDFDCDKNVFYIPDLWNGVPPMAHVSTGYSDKIKEVRDHILKEVSLSECSVTAHDMQIRLEDMWNGVLADDFLFSFKNNLVVKAYLMLETKFYKLTRQYESSLLKHIKNISMVELDKMEDKQKLHACLLEEETKLKGEQSRVLSACLEELEAFFDNSEVREHIIPWKDSKLKTLKLTLTDMGDQQCQELKYYCDCKQLELENILEGKSSFVQEAQVLAESMKNKKYDEKFLTQRFKEMWGKWIAELKLGKSMQTYDVKNELKKALEGILKTRGHTKFLKEEIVETGLFSQALSEVEEIQLSDMKKEHLANKNFPDDVSDTAKHWKGTELVPKQPSREIAFPKVVDKTNKLLGQVKHMLSKMMAEHLKFSPPLAHDILMFTIEEIDKHNALPFEQSDFSLTPTFEAMIAVHVARMACVRFEAMNAKFVETLSMDAKMEAFERKSCNLFMNTVQQQRSEAVADLLCDKIRPQIRENVNTNMSIAVVDTVLEKIQYKKHTLLVNVLKSLADDRSFNKNMEFIKDVYKYSAKWIEEDINRNLFDPFGGSTEYADRAKEFLASAISSTEDGLSRTFEKVQKCHGTEHMKVFIKHLKANLKNVSITDSEYELIQGQNITDFQQLKYLLEEKVTQIEKDLQNDFLDVTHTVVSKEDIMTKLWGCKAKCPLCLSPCIFTNPDHLRDDIDHECLQHWPKGFRGNRWIETKKLNIVICNFAITTGAKFNCPACSLKCHDDNKCCAVRPDYVFHTYKAYKKYLKNWRIEADSAGEASRYWQWVMFTYKKELAQYYKTKEPDVPNDWNIGKTAAVESLDKLSLEDFYKKKEGQRQENH